MPTVISFFLLFLTRPLCGKLTPMKINWFTIIESFPLSLYIYHVSCRAWQVKSCCLLWTSEHFYCPCHKTTRKMFNATVKFSFLPALWNNKFLSSTVYIFLSERIKHYSLWVIAICFSDLQEYISHEALCTWLYFLALKRQPLKYINEK